jgi:hypothetical protein
MGIAKTAAGIFALSVAGDAFKADRKATGVKEKLVCKTVGSVAAAASIHMLKDEVIDIVKEVKQITK